MVAWRMVAKCLGAPTNALGEESATGNRRVPRIDARTCQYVVKAGCKGSAVNELSGPGDLLDGDCCGFPPVTRRRSTRGTSSRGGAMTTTLEQAVSQIQQELLTIRAQVASRGRMSESVQATDNLTTAQSHEDVHSKASSCINTNDVGRPKEFSGKEEDLQHWSDDIKAFFAGVLKESKMMLDWTADQTMEITTTAIDLEFLPTESNGGRGVRNLEFVLKHMHEMLRSRTSQEANDIVANSQKNPLEAWRRLHERFDPTAGGRKRNILRTVISPGCCSLQELQAGIGRWESYVGRYEKLKGKLDDEIKRAAPESLVPELEKHLIFNSTRLETFEELYSEVVKYVEEKFGVKNS